MIRKRYIASFFNKRDKGFQFFSDCLISFWDDMLVYTAHHAEPLPVFPAQCSRIGFPLFFGFVRLSVEVWPDRVSIRYVPLVRREIALAQVEGAKARTYRPVLEYGGWGIRGWTQGVRVYSVSGDQCVEIDLADGKTVVLGSRRAGELAEAISAQLAAGDGALMEGG